MPIRVILIAGLLLLTLVALVSLRSRLGARLFLVAQFCLGIFLVLFPETTNWLAAKVGVGRGTDLLFYLAILAGYGALLIVLARFRRMERQLTELTRQVALRAPRQLPPEPPPQEPPSQTP